jgi:hypothetical protein
MPGFIVRAVFSEVRNEIVSVFNGNAWFHFISGVLWEVRNEILKIIYRNAGFLCISGVLC